MITMNQETIAKSKISDAVYAINEAVLNAQDGETIVFSDMLYDMHALYAYQKFCYITNNDFGLKNIALPLLGKKDLVIDGQGARLNFIGRIMPFYLQNCENITIKNFVIDYKRPFFSQGEVVEVGDDYAILDVDKSLYPYSIRNGLVRFEGEEYDSLYVHGLLEYDKTDRRPIPNVFDNSPCSSLRAEETKTGLLKIMFDWEFRPTVGSIMTIKHEHRLYPSIAIDACKNITLENITIYHAGTMGVVAQFSENIHVNKVDMLTERTTDRVMSINADATHFVNCTGQVIVENSKLEGMLDDIINVHGNYFRISHVIDPTHVVAEISHFQQVGAYGIKDGSKLEICNKETMLTLGTTHLVSTKVINHKYFELELSEAFDFEEGMQYCIDDVDAYPEVIFRNNDCGRNRARGLLLTGRKPILIENNSIDSEGSAIKVNGDMHNWYESTSITKLTIRGNKIRRRNQINWGAALIDIDPGMKKQIEGEYFHGDIIMEDNEIIVDGTPLFYGYSFHRMELKNNRITDLQKHITSDDTLTINSSNYGEIVVEGNTYQS